MTRKTLTDWTPADLDSAERCLRFALEADGPRDPIGWGLQAVATLRTCMAEVALRTLLCPLPDAPGQWWGRLPGGKYRAVDVVRYGGLVARTVDVGDLSLHRFEWLAGPDGKAVQCVPPEVTRG